MFAGTVPGYMLSHTGKPVLSCSVLGRVKSLVKREAELGCDAALTTRRRKEAPCVHSLIVQ